MMRMRRDPRKMTTVNKMESNSILVTVDWPLQYDPILPKSPELTSQNDQSVNALID